MTTPNDDQVLWDDDGDAKPAKRAAKPQPRRKKPDAVAKPADDGRKARRDDGAGGGHLLWILGGVGAGLAVLAVVAALLPWGTGGQPEVAAQPPAAQLPPPEVPQPQPIPQPEPQPQPEPPKPAVTPDPPVDHSLMNAPKPALKKPPAFDDPAELGRRATAKPGRALSVGAGVTKMAYSTKHDLLFTITATELAVHDAAGKNKIAAFPAAHAFTDLTVAPGGEAAYATDSPAEMVEGKPARVHRYDAAKRVHQSLQAGGLATRVTALDESQVAVAGLKDSLTAYFWPTQANRGLVHLSPLPPADGPVLFDPHRQRFHARAKWTGRDGQPATGIVTRDNEPRKNGPLAPLEARARLDRTDGELGNSFVLSPDGDLLFVGRVAVRTADQQTLPFAFREEILAAGRDVAVSVRGGCYHATSGTALGNLPFAPSSAAPAADGRRLWLYNPLTSQAAEFELAVAPPEVALPAAYTPRTGLLPRATDPAPAGSLVRAPEAAAKPFDQPVRRMTTAGRLGLVFLLTDTKLWVYDTAADKFAVAITAADDATLGDVALTPDETFAFVTESGGTTGDATPKPRGVQRVHRYGCADRRAESRDAPYMAHLVLPASADTVLLRGPANLNEVTLARWPTEPGKMRPLGDDGTPLEFRLRDSSAYGYDPFTGRFIVSSPGGRVSVWKAGGDGLVRADRDENGREHVGGARADKQVTVSSDGGFVYLGASQLPAGPPLAGEVKVFPKAAVAAARDVAVAADGTLFAAATGKECGHLGYAPEAVAVARDGRTVWGYDAAKKRLVRHAVGDQGAAVAPPVGPRDPVAFTAPANPFPPGAPLTATAGKTATLGGRGTSAHWVGYAPAGNYAFAQSAGKLSIFDATTGATKAVDGSPEHAFITATAPDQSALFVSAGPMYRLDIGKGSWASLGLLNRNALPDSHLVPLTGDTFAVFESVLGDTTGRLIVYRWDGTRRQSLGSEELSTRGLMYLGYDPASGELLAAWPEKAHLVFQRAWLDGGKLRLGGQIRIETQDRVIEKFVMSVTGKYGYVGPYRITSQDGKWEKVDYGGKVVAAAHDWVLTDKGELRDSATGKARGELGMTPTAAAFAPDGKSAWVADSKGGLVRYEFTAKAGVVAPPVALKSFADWTPPAVTRPVLPADRLTKFDEVGTVPQFLDGATSVLASDKYNLVVLSKSFFELIIVDAATGKQIPGPKGFRPMSAVLSPDQEALFASDFQGKVYRFTLKDRAWDSAKGDQVLHAAVDARTILTGKLAPGGPKGEDPIRLMSWTGGELVELAAAAAPGPLPKSVYDPVASRLYIAWSQQHPVLEGRLSAFPLGKKPFVEAWGVPVKGPHVRHDAAFLGSDGSRFYQRGEAFDTATGKVVAKFPEEIVTATRDAAVGLSGNLYDPTSGRKIGSVPHPVEAGGVTPDGRTVWLLDPDKKVVRKYQPAPAGGVVVAPPVNPPADPLVADDWSPTKVERPKLAAEPGTHTVLTAAATGVPPQRRASELVHSDRHERLLIAERLGRVLVYDGKTLKVVAAVGGPTAAAELSMAPDQSAVFASQAGKLFRLDLATLKWAARDSRFGTRIVAVGGDRLLVSDGVTKALTLIKWDADGLVPTARAELPAAADLLRYDPAAAVAFVLGRDPVPYLARVTVDRGKVSVGAKARVDATFNGGRIPGRLPLSWDGTRLFADLAVSTADGTTARLPGGQPDDVVGASRDLLFHRRQVTADGKTPRDAPYLYATEVAVSPSGEAVFVLDASNFALTRYAISAAVPKIKLDDFKATRLPRPDLPAGPLTKLTEAASVAAPPGGLSRLWCAAEHGLLLTTAANTSAVTLWDAKTGAEVPGPGGKRFTSFDFSPDRSVLFALEGGALHRLDCGTRKWESRTWPGGGYVALDANTILRLANSKDGERTGAVLRWGVRELTAVCDVPLTPGEKMQFRVYDPAAAALYAFTHDAKGTIATHLQKTPVGGKPFTPEWAVRVSVPRLSSYPQLGWDGKWLYRDTVAYSTADGSKREAELPEPFSAVLRDVAVGLSGKLYDPLTGGPLGALPHEAEAAAVARDGRSVWVYDQKARKLRQYAVTVGAVAPPAGKIEDFKPALVARPPSPATAATKFTETAAIDEPAAGAGVLLADRPGVLIVHSPSDLRLIDTRTGKPLPGVVPLALRPGPPALAPDQSALFVPSGDDLYRYDFTTKKWDTRPLRGGRMIPLDGTTVLLTPVVGSAARARVVRWTADGVSVLGTADLPALGAFTYDAATGHLYAVVAEPPGTKWHLKKFPVGGKPFAAEWGAALTGPTPLATPVTAADGKRVFVGNQAFDAATGKPVGNPLPEAVRFAAHGFLLGDSGKLYHPDTGKELTALPHPTAIGSLASDGTSAAFLDRTGAKVRWYAVTAGAVAPPMPKEPKDPKGPLVLPFPPGKKEPTGPAAPKLEGLRTVPYAAGTQTVAKEVDRLPYTAARANRIVAAEPLGVVAVLGPAPAHALRLFDTKTRKDLAVPSPLPTVRDILAPPDHTALFLTDNKNVYRLNAARTAWQKGPLPAGTRFVLPLSKDRLFAVREDQDDGRRPVLHDLRWADGELKDAKEVKLDRAPIFAWVGGNGRFQGLFSGGGAGLLVAEYDLTDGGFKTTWSVNLKPASGVIRTFRPSWDGGRLYRTGDLVDLTGPKVVESKPPAVLMAVSRDLLFGSDGEYYAADTGKPAGKFVHPVAAAGLTGDGKAIWVLDPDKKELVKYALTDGK